MSQRKVLYLIDGSSYIYRAFFAIAHLSNSRGMPTQAVYGFIQMIKKIREEKDPEFLAMVFDAKGPTFRHQLYPQYKANRPAMPEALQVQIPYIKQVCQGYGLPILEREGLEADDLIGSLTGQATREGFEVVIVSGDKDLMQLISPRVCLWDTLKDQVFDLATVKERFGTTPDRLTDIMGLSGDTSDNIPGVPGIGEKTAVKLLQTHGSLDQMYSNLAAVTPVRIREKLEQYRDQAYLSRQLATLDTREVAGWQAEAFRIKPPNREELKALFSELEFKKLLDDMGEIQEVRSPVRDYHGIFTAGDLAGVIRKIGQAGRVSLDLETTSEDPLKAEIVGIALSCREGEGVYVPVGHAYLGAPAQLPREEVLAALAGLIEDPGIEKIGQNIKYEWLVLHRSGLAYRGLAFDTMIASYLLNPGRRTHNLTQIAWEHLQQKLITYKEVAGSGPKALIFSEVAGGSGGGICRRRRGSHLGPGRAPRPPAQGRGAGGPLFRAGDALSHRSWRRWNSGGCGSIPGHWRTCPGRSRGSWTGWKSRFTAWPGNVSTSIPPSS